MFGPGSYPVHTVGKFHYHWHLGSPFRGIRQRLDTFRFYIRKGLELHRERRFDCIVTYSHMTTALLGVVLKLLTGARLIVEVVTSPETAYIAERARPRLRERALKLYSDVCLHLSLFMADRAHLLYPKQLHNYALLRSMPNSVFHEFVPVSVIDRDENREPGERYVLLVGAPWYLKGADIRVKAFIALAAEFPGGQAENSRLLSRPGGTGSIDGRFAANRNTQGPAQRGGSRGRLCKRATILVQPSRCEGLSRALIEAGWRLVFL